MEDNLVKQICGIEPENFIKAEPNDSNFIFQNDPNCSPINLYISFATYFDP